jgi:hypothetical protein
MQRLAVRASTFGGSIVAVIAFATVVTSRSEERRAVHPGRHRPSWVDHARRAPEREALLRPFLDAIFVPRVGASAPYELECDPTVCDLFVLDPYYDSVWMQPFQSYGFSEQVGPSSMVIGGNGANFYLHVDPGSTPIRIEPGLRETIQLYFGIDKAYQRSPRAFACRMSHRDAGELVLDLSIDRASHQLTVRAERAAAASAGGACMRDALEEVVRTRVVPPRFVTGRTYTLYMRL